jgi:hypothetical protein
VDGAATRPLLGFEQIQFLPDGFVAGRKKKL